MHDDDCEELVRAVVEAFERGQTIVEMCCGMPYFTIFFQGDEVLVNQTLLTAIESRVGQPLVSVVVGAMPQAWPKGRAMELLISSAAWKQANSAASGGLRFNDWAEEHCNENLMSRVVR